MKAQLSDLALKAHYIIVDDEPAAPGPIGAGLVTICWSDYGDEFVFPDQVVDLDSLGGITLEADDGEEHYVEFKMLRPITQKDLKDGS